VTGGRVTVANVPHPSLQGDTAFVDILRQMGCRVTEDGHGITVQGPEELRGVTVDMADCPDVAPTVAVVAAFARGETIIKNIAHLRIKECDRLHVMATELSKIGVGTKEGEDYLVIHGSPEAKGCHGAQIDTHEDHRIAMCFAVAGLRVAGIAIENPGCVAKSFPDFWQRFALLADAD